MADVFVGVTDREWFERLGMLKQLDEVNFWHPSPSQFRALEPGGLFLFKLHAPHDAIVGGGIFAHHSVLPVSLAWDAFGAKNGAASLEEMMSRLAHYHRQLRSLDWPAQLRFPIGCTLIEQPFFFPAADWFPVPDWHRNIVTGKGYSLSEPAGQELWRLVQDRRTQPTEPFGVASPAPRYGLPILVQPRLGQGSFRVMVADAYRRRCAITGERVLPVLDAAHIIPYAEGGQHQVSNGLLLRRDLHTLFDDGYLTVTPDLRVEVSRRLKDDWENGRDYYALDGSPISLPARGDERPDPDALLWHRRHWGFAA